ncbi:VTC domain-containing protein [Litorihabitans aurantiacus]|uniref:VTC domain-containing protein n=1 Tax=Litorihabitans aurantiacus TaxID=1930061 RepID=A0AA37XI85_9MICO|nr:VTC domain-containing protein [Litorihabitans aurantiacus]GMA33426.1 hypothetical protein GCM10025875_34180 [Litorihabitans aurantiacus]
MTAPTTATPITLAELVASAALLTRTDRKYLLPTAQLAVVAHADPDLRVLTIDGATAHAYRSTYLDTADLTAYRLAALGRPDRFKVRRRTYVGPDLTYLEVKTAAARGATVKDRLELAVATPEEARRFAAATVRMRTGHEIAPSRPSSRSPTTAPPSTCPPAAAASRSIPRSPGATPRPDAP